MQRVVKELGLGFLLLLLAAATVHLALHFNVSQYSGPKATYTVAGFVRQYTSGVYAYRPLARELLLWLNQLLFDGKNLYEARVVLTGVALFGLNVFFVSWQRAMGVKVRDALLGVLALGGLVALSLYVRSNPYTVLVLAYLAVGLWLSEKRWWLPMIGLALLGPPLHGMTAIAVIAIVARHHVVADEGRARLRWGRADLIRSGSVAAVWLASYVGLRLFIDTNAIAAGVFDSLTTEANAQPGALLVAGFGVAVVGMLLARGVEGRRIFRPDLALTAALALPFACLMFFFGRLVEVRLFLPFLVVAVGYALAAARGHEATEQGASEG